MAPHKPADLHQLGALIAAVTPAASIADEDWSRLVARAVQHGLAPMLWWRLKREGFILDEDARFAPLIETAHHTAVGAALLDHGLRAVDTALRDAAIPALWLKGAALAPTVYPEPALRPMGDLDVLVPYDQREAALAVIQRIGYDFYEDEGHIFGGGRDPLLARLSYHYHRRGGPGSVIVLEVHYRLLSSDDELLPLDQHAWFWSQRAMLTLADGFVLHTLTPEAHLLYLCAHALLQHGGADTYLLRILDLHLLIAQSDLRWDVIVDQAVVFGWTTPIAEALTAAQAYFSTPVPVGVLDALRARRPVHEDPARVARLSRSGSRWQQVRLRLASMSWGERAAFVRRIVLPSPAYMRARYQIADGKAVWPYYAARWIDQARDIASAGWKQLTGQYRPR